MRAKPERRELLGKTNGPNRLCVVIEGVMGVLVITDPVTVAAVAPAIVCRFAVGLIV